MISNYNLWPPYLIYDLQFQYLTSRFSKILNAGLNLCPPDRFYAQFKSWIDRNDLVIFWWLPAAVRVTCYDLRKTDVNCNIGGKMRRICKICDCKWFTVGGNIDKSKYEGILRQMSNWLFEVDWWHEIMNDRDCDCLDLDSVSDVGRPADDLGLAKTLARYCLWLW